MALSVQEKIDHGRELDGIIDELIDLKAKVQAGNVLITTAALQQVGKRFTAEIIALAFDAAD